MKPGIFRSLWASESVLLVSGDLFGYRYHVVLGVFLRTFFFLFF